MSRYAIWILGYAAVPQDPLPGDRSTTLEEWMDTLGAVLDAAGVERAALVAHDFGGMMAMLFAAAHPERVSGLILLGSSARMKVAPDYPIGFPEEMNARGTEWWLRVWGTGDQNRLTSPSLADDEKLRALQAKYDLSLKVAEPLVEKITRQPPGTVIVASGTSCRHQIEHLMPIRARHMAEVLMEALA